MTRLVGPNTLTDNSYDRTGRQPIPLSKRPGDIVLLVFFVINLLFITYVVDLESLVIPDPAHFTYPIWPPRPAVDLIHWWGNNFDPVLIARPPWWKTTIWIDALLFGPFYAAAIYAYIRGKEWIRIPSLLYGAMLIPIVLVILSEERYGPNASPRWPVVLLANLPWLLFPLMIIYRMWRFEYPFSLAVPSAERLQHPATLEDTPATTGNR